MHTAHTGEKTNASIRVKAVDKIAESKIKGETIDPNILEHLAKPNTLNNTTTSQAPQRSAAMDAKMAEAKRIAEEKNSRTQYNNNRNSNAGIADAISQYTNTPQVGAPMNNNSSMLTEQQMLEKLSQNGYKYAPNNVINEQVTQVTRELLNENFGKLFAEAMKNTIIENYKREVIKEAINDNRSYIEQIVRETIIDLQKKAQSK